MEKNHSQQSSAPTQPGRPRIDFDLDVVFGLGKLGCTYEDIAARFDCSVRTIKARMNETEEVDGEVVDSPMRRAFERGLGECRRSLRSMQMEKAKEGDATMLIWLGKQLLGQTDRKATELTGAGGGPIQTESKVIAVPAIAEEAEE